MIGSSIKSPQLNALRSFYFGSQLTSIFAVSGAISSLATAFNFFIATMFPYGVKMWTALVLTSLSIFFLIWIRCLHPFNNEIKYTALESPEGSAVSDHEDNNTK